MPFIVYFRVLERKNAMSEDDSQKGFSKEDSIDASYLSMIRDANKILDTLSKVWKFCLIALLLSLSIVGLVSIGLFALNQSSVQFFSEGVIFLIIAVWVFARNLLGSQNKCCAEDIPYWKSTLASFVKADNTLDTQKDGQSVIENLIKVVYASGDWIRTIKRDVFSVLFWPLVAIVIFLLTVYQANVVQVRIIEIAFVAYMFALVIAVYYGVNLRFKRWQTKVDRFRSFTSKAIETL